MWRGHEAVSVFFGVLAALGLLFILVPEPLRPVYCGWLTVTRATVGPSFLADLPLDLFNLPRELLLPAPPRAEDEAADGRNHSMCRRDSQRYEPAERTETESLRRKKTHLRYNDGRRYEVRTLGRLVVESRTWSRVASSRSLTS